MTDTLHDIAARHEFSDDAAFAALDALLRGSGMAQFNHPELGGYGQWMNGMVMLGRMGDHALQGRVAALFSELSHLAAKPLGSAHPQRNTMEPMKPMQPMKPMAPMKPIKGLDAPADWGQPASSGGQNDVKYAYFSRPKRLVVERDGKRTVYDTADHDIGGVSQDQSDVRAGRLVFTSQQGPVAIDALKIVSE